MGGGGLLVDIVSRAEWGARPPKSLPQFPLGSKIAFIGLKSSALTSQERSDLYAWTQSYYGVT